MDSRSFDAAAGAHVHLNETARNLAADHALAEIDAIALTVYIELPVTVPLYFRGHHRTDYAAGHRIEAVHPRIHLWKRSIFAVLNDDVLFIQPAVDIIEI